MTAPTWREKLGAKVPADLAEEIDVFQTQMQLRRQGKLDEKIFAELRLRRGAYGQRYDNGQRYDGVETKPLAFPNPDATKGPDTKWDAPGMMRIKIPMGAMTGEQLDCLAELAEEYSDRILHVTTRQDIQLHFIHIEDTPALMRRLAAVGITTREACGNSVRNITACQFSGTCSTEGFDVTPYARAMTYYLLGHKDVQDFGRKFKIAFSGCGGEACGLAKFHCIGCVATTKVIDGEKQRGFEFYVGGGLGAVPRQAKLMSNFVPEDELLPLSQAVCRVFARLGEKANRARARLKFLVDSLGIEEFTRLVEAERKVIPEDERWTAYLDDLEITDETPQRPGSSLDAGAQSAEFQAWYTTNVRPQKQAGYSVATVRLPLGDFTSEQARGLVDVARKYCGDAIRLTVEQNVVLRWIPNGDLPAFHADLKAIQLGQPGAGSIADITACPGTDTCKLGISASRGLAAVLEEGLAAKASEQHPDARKLRIKTSGCFNSCGQHHVADIGFLGVSRNVKGRRVSHFQLVVGGEWANNGGSYGLAIGAFPSKRIPDVVDAVVENWMEERTPGESFQNFIKRVGKGRIRELLQSYKAVPDYAEDPSFYVDWGDAREYTIGDMGVGECAGEIVTLVEFGLSAGERHIFEAQLYLDTGDAPKAAETAYRGMLEAAKALIQVWNIDVTSDAEAIVGEFRTRLHDTKVFHDPYAGAKFANYLLKAHASPPQAASHDEAHHLIEEAQLFVEAAHACYDRIQEADAQAAKKTAPDSALRIL